MNSRYLNVLRTGLLIGDVSLYGRFRNSADAADVIATAPERRHARFKPREFFSQFVRGESLELSSKVRGSPPRVRLNEHVNVVGHNFQRVNLSVQFCRPLIQQLSQAFLHGSDENLQAILGTPHQVILERVDGSSTNAISSINHETSVPPTLDIRKQINKEDRIPLPAEASSSLRF